MSQYKNYKPFGKFDPRECKRGSIQTCQRLTTKPEAISLLPEKCKHCTGVTV